MISTMKKNSGILILAALLSTGLVAITHTLTESKITEQAQEQLLKTLNQVIPESLYDNALTQTCTFVTDPALNTSIPQRAFIATRDQKPVAIAVETIAPDGYNGTIKLLVATDLNQNVLGVRVLQHNETPGLGDKVDLNISDWILSFTNKTIEFENDERWAVRKDGGQFDQFTGATITPRAVVNAAKKAAWFIQQQQAKIITQPLNCGDRS